MTRSWMGLAILAAWLSLGVAAKAAPTSRIEADRLAVVAEQISLGADAAGSIAAWTAAIAAAEQAYGPASHAAARALVGLADAQQNSPDSVISNAAKALAIAEALKPQDETVMAEALVVLGAGYGLKYDIPKSQEYLTRAYDLTLKLYGPEDPRLARVLTEQGWGMVRSGDPAGGVVPLKRAVEIDRAKLKPSDPQRINNELLYAGALANTTDLAGAELVIRQVLEDVSTLPLDHPRRAMALGSMAFSLVRMGRSDEAGELYIQSADQLRRMNQPLDLADSLSGLGFVRLDQERFAEAQALFMEAHDLNLKGGNPVSAAMAWTSAGTAAAKRGDYAVALKLRLDGLAALEAMDNKSAVAIALTQYKLADSYAQAGEMTAAMASETKAAAVIRKIRGETHPQRLGLEINMGWITALAGDPKAGLAIAGPAALRMENESRKLEVAQVKTTGVKENSEPFGRALRTSELAQDAEMGFHFAQVLVETDAGRAAAAANARAAAGPLVDALRRRQTLTAEKIKLDDAYLASSADPAKATMLKAQVATAQEGIAEAEALLDRDFPTYRDLTYPAPIKITAAQAKLDQGEVLIVPVSTDEGLFIFAMTRDSLAWDRSPLARRDVAGLVRRMRASIDAGVGVRAAVDASGASQAASTAFDRQAAWTLYQAIFTPKIRALTDRARVYTLATSDAFGALPFAMLVTAEPKGNDADPAALRTTSWLVRKAAIQVAPSIPAMRAAAGVKASGRDAFFGAGAPTLAGGGVRASRGFLRGGVDAASIKGLAALPGADAELHAMATTLGSDQSQVLTGDQATETAVKAADLRQVRVVAFATHGLTAGELPGLTEPALVFTPRASSNAADDALLTASEAAQLKLDADWVILSACNTAAGETGGSAGYTGLARAFILAGGRHVLVSHWPVRDDAAARLTVDTVRSTARGQQPAQALRRAMLKMIDDRGVPNGADPAVWAPFVVFGR